MFTKCFDNKLDFDRETKGYEFFSSYYNKTPKILDKHDKNESCCVVYEKIDSAHKERITDMLCKNQTVDLGETFTDLSSIANKHCQKCRSTGGTQIFYIERADKLAGKQMIDIYAEYLRSSPVTIVNGRQAPIEKGLLLQLQERVRDFHRGVCIPSQGDIHERNIFTDGYIIDFEGSGWTTWSMAIDRPTSVEVISFATAQIVGSSKSRCDSSGSPKLRSTWLATAIFLSSAGGKAPVRWMWQLLFSIFPNLLSTDKIITPIVKNI